MAATRRDLLKLGLLGAAAPAVGLPLLGRRARAAGSPADRRFLFIFCEGGWDPAWGFAPLFDSTRVDMPARAAAAEVNGIPFVDLEDAPSMRAFYEQYGDQTVLINGIDIPAVAHPTCERILMTNSASPGGDDWAAILAAKAASRPLVPHLLVSGPEFANRYASSVVRVGNNGQLGALLDRSALGQSDLPVNLLSDAALRLADARSVERARPWAESAPAGRAAAIGELAYAGESAFSALAEFAPLLTPSAGSGLQSQVIVPLRALATGLSRTAMVAYKAWEQVFNGWDTHESIELQANHFEELFATLSFILDGSWAEEMGVDATVLDNLTIVVLSEMGRFPTLNTTGGKDHWNFTSALLIGAGVAGGRAIGGYDDALKGRDVDLASGDVRDGATPMHSGHLGATLLALGDVDPAEFVVDASPITAALA